MVDSAFSQEDEEGDLVSELMNSRDLRVDTN